MKNRLFAAAGSAVLCVSLQALAVPGDLDPAFGNGGRVSFADGTAAALLVQPDGKVLVAGTRRRPQTQFVFPQDPNEYFVRRLLPGGTVDTGFGDAGMVSAAYMSGYLGYNSFGRALGLRADGKMLVAGMASGDAGVHMAVARRDSTGAIDASFGGETNASTVGSTAVPGVRWVDFQGRSDGAAALAMYPDGRLVLAGTSSDSGGSTFAVARLLENGAPDASFGAGGKVRTTVGTGPSGATAAVLLPDGRVLAGGYSTTGTTEGFALVRYLANGSPDPSFGAQGIVTHPIDGGGRISALALLPSGKILAVGGNINGASEGLALARYNADGSLDYTFEFEGRGIVRDDFNGPAMATGIAVQADGRILVTAMTPATIPSNLGLIVMRFGANGADDISFGPLGVTRPDLNAARGPTSIALQPDGKAVVAAGTDALRLLLEMAPLSPDTLAIHFGRHSLQTTARRRFTLHNVSSGAHTVSSAAVPAPFGVGAITGCAVLQPQGACSIEVFFSPTADGTLYAETLTLQTSAGPVQVHLAGNGERSLVSHYYSAVLARQADYAGKQFWEAERNRLVALGANVNEVWFLMANYFFNSAEYQALGKTDTQFLTDVYATFFNRAPDQGGFDYWMGQMNAGLSREGVIFWFMFSNEFRAFTQGLFGNTAARPEVDMVMDLFRGILNRFPETAAFNAYVGSLRQAQCEAGNQRAGAVYKAVNDMSYFFLFGGAEYPNRARTHAQFVSDLYNAFLRRGGTDDEVDFWIDQLNTGASDRNAMRASFIASPEFGARVNAVIAAGCVS